MQTYAPRPITALPPLRLGGWTLKRYSIVYGDKPFEPTRFDIGRRLALGELPVPPKNAERPGVGFIIEHQGNKVDYLVLAWWDRENELPLRVYVRAPFEDWRPAQKSESVCVWDLEVIWREREAYVSTLMRGEPVEAYLQK